MTTPTPPAVTADGLAAALRLIDSFAPSRAEPVLFAVFAVARTSMVYERAAAAVMAPDGPWTGEARAMLHKALDDAHAAKTAAIADLAALATATGHATATAGQGAS